MIKDTRQQDIVIAPKANIFHKSVMTVIGICIVGLIVFLMFDVTSAERSIDLASVQIAQVERGTLERDINAMGKIVAANAPIIYSTAIGRVTLLVNPGDKIGKDQKIAIINSPELLNKLHQEQASLQSFEFSGERLKLQSRRSQLQQEQQLNIAKVALNAAKREFRRSKIAIKDNLISQIDFEKSEDDLARALLEFEHEDKQAKLNQDSLIFDAKTQQAVIDRQQFVVTEIQRQVDNLILYSPVAGIVGNWLTSQKSAVNVSQTLMTIVDLTAFEAELLIAESYAEEIGLGMKVEIQVAGQLLHGELSAISPEVINRQVSTRVRFKNADEINLRQNQRLSARIILEKKANVLMIRRGAFLQTGAGKVAYLVNENLAIKQTIEIGSTSISHIELQAGVKVGDRMIISSLDAFEDAEQVILR